MNLASLRVHPLEIPFRVSFKHSSAERAMTGALLARAETAAGHVGKGEGCPRPYVTGETLATAADFFNRHNDGLVAAVHTLEDLRSWVGEHETDIDANPAAWCALELALIEALAKDRGESVEGLLGLPELAGPFAYTAVLGEADEAVTAAQTERYARLGFQDFKIKVGGDAATDRARILIVAEAVPKARIRLDANNLWKDPAQVLAYLDALRAGIPEYTPPQIFALEEPLQARDFAGLGRLAQDCPALLILDESFLNRHHFDGALGLGGKAVINLRVSKMGGLIRSLRIVETAREKGIPLIVGAQVGETSILTRAGLTVASAVARDGTLIAQEGAFGTLLLETDVVEKPLMFGPAGRLDPRSLLNPAVNGFGLEYLDL